MNTRRERAKYLLRRETADEKPVGRAFGGKVRTRAKGKKTSPISGEGEGAKVRGDRKTRGRAFGGSVIHRAEGGPISEDPFERAALRTQQSVMPEGGRQEGLATQIPEQMAVGAATLPQRAFEQAGNASRGEEFSMEPIVNTAMGMVGTPGGVGGLGSGARGRVKASISSDFGELSKLLRSENVKVSSKRGGLFLPTVREEGEIVAPAYKITRDAKGYHMEYPDGWRDMGIKKGAKQGPFKSAEDVFHRVFED